MTDPTASAQKATTFAARMADELAAYARRYGFTLDGSVAASGATLGGTIGNGRAKRDLEALMRRWGGQFTATENEDGTLTIAGTLAVTATPDPPPAPPPTLLLAEEFPDDALDATRWPITGGIAGVAGGVVTANPGSYMGRHDLWDGLAMPTASGSLSLRWRATIARGFGTFGGFWANHADPADARVVSAGVASNPADDRWSVQSLRTDDLGTAATDSALTPVWDVPHWYEVLYRRDGHQPATARFYVDGTLVAEQPDLATGPSTTDSYPTGYWLGGTDGSVAQISHVTIADGYQGVPH